MHDHSYTYQHGKIGKMEAARSRKTRCFNEDEKQELRKVYEEGMDSTGKDRVQQIAKKLRRDQEINVSTDQL